MTASLLNSPQVARLIRRKFRPLDTESARGLENQNGGSERTDHINSTVIFNIVFKCYYYRALSHGNK